MNSVNLANAINLLVQKCHQNSVEHGFYDGTYSFGEKIALITSECSEALECHRRDPEGVRSPDEHCPSHPNVTVELADACIRIFDLCGYEGLNLGQAIIDKMSYNESRPYRHNKNY